MGPVHSPPPSCCALNTHKAFGPVPLPTKCLVWFNAVKVVKCQVEMKCEPKLAEQHNEDVRTEEASWGDSGHEGGRVTQSRNGGTLGNRKLSTIIISS